MNLYVIQRTDGRYVARSPIVSSSYVKQLQHAQVYRTREDAERNLCPGNERIVTVADAMGER